jgi:ubiquinone/menaquinone biosynthesis C-methylase UbiE/uncharacterized protein YbaR (Trm112 family)
VNPLFKFLVCPSCKGALVIGRTLKCKNCRRVYHFEKGIPVLIPDTDSKQLKIQQQIFNREYGGLQKYILHNWQVSFINRLVSSFGLEKKKKGVYIDVGSGGAGYTVIELAKKGLYGVGIDLSMTGMLKAKRFAEREGVGDRCLFVVCDAERLPLKSDSFNFVSCIMLLEHLKNDQMAAQEISRITKKGGKVFISVPNTYFKMWPFLWPLYLVWDRKLGHVRHYSAGRLSKLFKSNNLKRDKIFYTVHLVKFLQLALDKITPPVLKNRVWWWLEDLDWKQTHIQTGLNLNALFEK